MKTSGQKRKRNEYKKLKSNSDDSATGKRKRKKTHRLSSVPVSSQPITAYDNDAALADSESLTITKDISTVIPTSNNQNIQERFDPVLTLQVLAKSNKKENSLVVVPRSSIVLAQVRPNTNTSIQSSLILILELKCSADKQLVAWLQANNSTPINKKIRTFMGPDAESKEVVIRCLHVNAPNPSLRLDPYMSFTT